MPPRKPTTVTAELDALYPLLETDNAATRIDKLHARAVHKALAHRDNAKKKTSVKVDGRTVKVSGVLVDDKGRLVFTADHNDIPPEANPFIFVNPPILVPDIVGTREDLDEAFDKMVSDAVMAAL